MIVQTAQSPMTVGDYCAAMDRRDIQINSEYQRSDRVWPPVARSFLIESILEGYPIPKIFLYQRTDLKSKKSIKEIVDGQQRSKAIHDFYSNQLRLSRRCSIVSAAGRTYDELDEDLKGRFLNYQLSIELFLSASEGVIRESFRRLNSYNVPLKPEEQRHAEFQGAFKWFIYHRTQEYEEAFLQMGVFSSKQFVRMQDAKLLSEVADAMLNGVRTTNKAVLDRLYKSRDKIFQEEADLQRRLFQAFDFLVGMTEVYKTALMRPHIFYSLLLATMHVIDPLPSLNATVALEGPLPIDRERSIANLTYLSYLISADEMIDIDVFLDSFLKACSDQTNVKKHREVRIAAFCKAFGPELL